MTPPWIGRIRGLLKRWHGEGLGPGWVVAVSGGSDSVALLRILHRLGPELGLRLSVAHLDHGARGASSVADAEFVEALAGSLGLPFDLGHWRPERSAHFEVDARDARYAWLVETAVARGASAVAVGHTRDDQAETILHRIVRGTGLRGLAGMPARRRLGESLTLVRPLLGASRLDLRAYLADLGQPYRDDPTNQDISRTRARIRHDLLPRLVEEYNPQASEAIVRLGGLASSFDRALRRRVLEVEREVTSSVTSDEVVLVRPALAALPSVLRAEVLRVVWRRAGWPEAGMSAERWRRLASLARRSGSRVSIGAGVEALTTDGSLTLRRAGDMAEAASSPVTVVPATLVLPGEVPWGNGRLVATLDLDEPRDETLDLDRLVAPLVVRQGLPGDRFEPLGMGGRSRALNDFFRGRRVPFATRGAIPVVCDQLGIVWVAGHRIADRVRITESTRRSVGLRWDVDCEDRRG